MDQINLVYEFIDLAEKNRKYPANTAHGRRAAVKLFETVITGDERKSLDLIQERMKEIYLNLISKHKEGFSIKSLNTYKSRFLKVIQDYQRHGTNPDAFNHWETKQRKYTVKNIKDSKLDIDIHNLSFPIHKGVHKIQISLEGDQMCIIETPNLTKKDAIKVKEFIDWLAN